MSAVSLRASFHVHDFRNGRVRKNSLGSISITTSLRGNLPSPREDRLVLLTIEACVYRNVSRHATHRIRRGNSYSLALEQDSYFDVNKRNLVVFDDQMIYARKDKRIVNLFTPGSHHRNLSRIYILQNLFQQGKGSRSISLIIKNWITG